jgi:hypothetical protein
VLPIDQLELKIVEEEAAIFEKQFLEDFKIGQEKRIAHRRTSFQRNQSLPL